MNDQITAVIVAAGTASRYGTNKILDTVGGRPAVVWSVEAFAANPRVDSIVVVTQADLIAEVTALVQPVSQRKLRAVVAGGKRRQDSVTRGFAEAAGAAFVLIHDGARPLVTQATIDATVEALRAGADAAIAAIPVTDTLKRASGESVSTVDRTSLYRAQTPQGFRVEVLRQAMARAASDGGSFTDEAAMVEEQGFRVVLVPGDERAVKLTVPGDRAIVEALMAERNQPMITRTGIGYDVHRFVKGRPLVLGGIEIPHTHGLDGHSDADVVLHAMTDAILGACAMGDIGQHFPPGEETWRDISSLILLERVAQLIGERGFAVVHLDAMVIAEAPKIGSHVPEMRERIARTLAVPIDSISIKATSNEGMGFIGRQEGIAAMATATIEGPRQG